MKHGLIMRALLLSLVACIVLGVGATGAFAVERRVAPAAVSAADDDIDDATYVAALEDGPSTTINGDLATELDYDDVYAVWLMAGEVFSASVTPAPGTDFGVFVFGPDAESVFMDSPLANSVLPQGLGGPGGSPLTVSPFIAPTTGIYYIDVATDDVATGGSWNGGSGSYTLDMSLSRLDTDVVITSSATTLNFLDAPVITGAIYDRYDNAPSGNVFLYYSLNGYDFIPLQAATTNGTFAFEGLNQWQKTWYMVSYQGNADWSPNSEVSRPYMAKAYLATPSGPSTMTHGVKKTFTTVIAPKHTSGSYPVRIYKYKKTSSGSWKSYGYVKAKASTIDDWSSKCSVSMSLPYKGSWRVRAVHVADSGHATTYSGYKYVTVK